MKYAVIDAETNGLPDYKKPADDPSQPRLASLGVIMVDDVMEPLAQDAEVSKVEDTYPFKIEAQHEFLVKPAGWKMTPGAAAVNGLTDERLEAEGIDISDVLRKYATLVEAGYVVVAYGAQHDCKILRGEFRRAGLPDRFEITNNVCLMRGVQPLKIPKANGKGGWPQLDDCLRYFGKKPEPRPHGALVGAKCALEIFAALYRMNKLPEASVHYAKNPPVKPS